jgi:hypothetical protein
MSCTGRGQEPPPPPPPPPVDAFEFHYTAADDDIEEDLELATMNAK